ncbi:putative disease resistance protein RGA1 [Sorghum bicolor]|uniref:putative disease resistance protein RGA1 n=1 Tax=Sorghum bicolor TaxID=4558 RepID=UPI0001A885CA|nr:putative disease resistance protein RGA1 [Sorghum bicolor]|eukprot:XP_002443307.1 putative disease resistance protein RGA1 [Sorghum bicolor]
MADTIISAIISDLVSRAISILIGRFSNQESTEDRLQRMRYLVIRIHSVVEEAKGRQISNHGTLQWLSELIDVEYQGCYLLESVGYGGGKQEVERDDDDDDDKVNPQVSTLSLFNPAKRVRVAAAGCTVTHASSWSHDSIGGVDEIERVLQRLQGMCQDLREFILLLQDCKPIRRPLPTNIFRDGQMFGRHVEKEKIINFLLHEDDQLGVLPIVGGSGVGKTTLVQYACDDTRVRSHFPVIMLYCLSSTYGVKNNEGTSSNDPLELVQSNTTFRGEQKRCLVIFEDVEMHKKQILEEFFRSPRSSNVGMIKMIITTNNPRVANIVGTVEPIMLKVLQCPEYWFFFKAHAFAGRDVEENPRLISAGKAIARKLNGSFFGAKIVGGVLRDHPDARHWCEVLRSNIIEEMCPLSDGMNYISDLADNLLPDHVDMWKVTLSKDPSFPPRPTQQLVMLKDVQGAAPHDSMLACWADDLRFAKVLLCQSVLPFLNHYYIARCSCTCTVGSENPCSKLVLSNASNMSI